MEPNIISSNEARFDPKHTALILIDMQKDLACEGFVCDRAGRDLSATRGVIPNMEKLLSMARASGTLVCHVGFWTLPENRSDSGPWLAQRRRSTYSSDKLCIADTEGAEFIDDLAPEAGELVIRKHRYSAFKGTDLDMTLRAQGIKSIVVTGVSTKVCVESTLRDRFEIGYYSAIVEDATASWDMKLHRATIETINHRFGVVLKTSDLERLWQVNQS